VQSSFGSVIERDQLISEMNSLMEQLVEAEAKAAAAVAESRQIRDKLSDYDRASAREQEQIMQAAQMEMDNMKHQFQLEERRMEDQLAKLSSELKSARSEERVVKIHSDELSMKLQKSEKLANHYKNEWTSIQKELSQKQKGEGNVQIATQKALEAAQDEVQSVVRDKEVLIARMKLLQSDITESNQRLEQLNNEYMRYREEMKETLAVKDRRIKHLDSSKLTQEQMEKIKKVKEEKEKYQSECKTMKKQLQQLMKVHERVTANDSSEETSTSQLQTELIETKLKLTEVSLSLESTQNVVRSMKEKIGECSTQLREYETERESIIDVLEKFGIDTRAFLISSDSSGSVEDSVIDHDLGEAVGKLGQKLSHALNQLQSQTQSHQSVSTSHQIKLRELEERVISLSAEVEEARAQRNAFENRVEGLRVAAASSEAQEKSSSLQVSSLTQQLEEVQAELDLALTKMRAAEESVSTEVQALEEENIELLRENKELRRDVASYRTKLERAQNQADSTLTTDGAKISSSLHNVHEKSNKKPVLHEHNLFNTKLHNDKDIKLDPCLLISSSKISGDENENIHPNRVIETATDSGAGITKPSSNQSLKGQLSGWTKVENANRSSLAKGNNLPSSSAQTTESTIATGPVDQEASKVKRTRVKAKAIVTSEISSEETGGECAQS